MRDHQLGLGPVDGNLPLELAAFVGRSAELAGLAGALDAARLVTVTGAGGIGKSRLAARAGARCAPRDGVWRVELAPLRDPEFVDHAVVEALGLRDHTTRLPRETPLAHLAERELLLVLDGFEHLAQACAELLALVTAVEGDAAEAAVLQGAAGRMWRSVGLPLSGSAYYNSPHELCEATARERLGDARYEEYVREGARLVREAAVSRALERPLDALPAPRGPVRYTTASAPTHEPAASRTHKGGETAG